MKILYCHDNIYLTNSEGDAFSEGQFSYAYWAPYIKICDELIVAGRGREISDDDDYSALNRSDGENVRIETLPNMNSAVGLLQNRGDVLERVQELVEEADGIIVRTMSEIGWLAFKHAKKLGKPIAHEVAGCPWDNTWNHGSFLAKAYAPIRAKRMRYLAKNADYVLYVSKDFLPNRYPAKGETAIASNVRIEKPSPSVLERRLERIQSSRSPNLPYEIGLIGHLDHKLKGIGVAIEALSILNKSQSTHKFELKILGPGQASNYRHLVREYDLQGSVRFDGALPSGKPVLEWLDHVDLYVQPSFHEGVPRATIEAMSRGCPAFGSNAGGIPELLEDSYIHSAGDAQTLAEQILKSVTDNTLQAQAETNFKKSMEYTQDVLEPIRDNFWQSFAQFIKDRNKDIAA
ncbi:MAG: glycosyltransferase family 4 protein [Bdellovibrionales bacterium]